MKGTKKKPPSRIKYEESHPVISFRVSKETYDNLVRIKAQTGLGLADIVKSAINKQEIDLVLSYWGGYEDAEKIFRVNYRCSVCGKTTAVTTKDEKETIAKYMNETGWAHAKCLNSNS